MYKIIYNPTSQLKDDFILFVIYDSKINILANTFPSILWLITLKYIRKVDMNKN